MKTTKQIAISDVLYEQLDELRKYKGRRFSFNTVIDGLLREALLQTSSVELYRKMQWHAIQTTLRMMEEKGWIETYRIQDAHILRMVINGQYGDALEYLREQYPLDIPTKK